ncbi:MAG TPA: ribonuclease HI family protein [Methanomassiliicoccaceae archaeon]|nr:ribonuclease HI family protein [Methanomassiliicoccaceae archaeon]
MKLTIYIDGGARGNPGPAAFAIVVTGDGKIIKEYARYIGRTTNNVAEYQGAIAALKEALAMGANEVEVISDSELMVRQVNGQYACRAPNLQPYLEEIRELSRKFDNVTFSNVRRGHPMVTRADALLNKEQDIMRDLMPRGKPNP